MPDVKASGLPGGFAFTASVGNSGKNRPESGTETYKIETERSGLRLGGKRKGMGG